MPVYYLNRIGSIMLMITESTRIAKMMRLNRFISLLYYYGLNNDCCFISLKWISITRRKREATRGP